ncbi:MAG TPA: hypothetical protein PLX20_11450 [Rhodocyclaceae bacterium]|nr:hypothetical protein [Rhodocyclaceae bacterium]HNH13745.1 hypothetical protein [Rhodocyclaceae bacterium]HNH98395.1 hypothetical protein [Rhodocyclaceae bacterium]
MSQKPSPPSTPTFPKLQEVDSDTLKEICWTLAFEEQKPCSSDESPPSSESESSTSNPSKGTSSTGS